MKKRYNIRLDEERNRTRRNYQQIFLGLIMILLSVGLMRESWVPYDLQRHGQLVVMHAIVIGVPGTNHRNSVLFLNYNGLHFVRPIKDTMRYDYSPGDHIKVFYKPGVPEIAMPGDRPVITLTFCAIFVVFGTAYVVNGFKKKKH